MMILLGTELRIELQSGKDGWRCQPRRTNTIYLLSIFLCVYKRLEQHKGKDSSSHFCLCLCMFSPWSSLHWRYWLWDASSWSCLLAYLFCPQAKKMPSSAYWTDGEEEVLDLQWQMAQGCFPSSSYIQRTTTCRARRRYYSLFPFQDHFPFGAFSYLARQGLHVTVSTACAEDVRHFPHSTWNITSQVLTLKSVCLSLV